MELLLLAFVGGAFLFAGGGKKGTPEPKPEPEPDDPSELAFDTPPVNYYTLTTTEGDLKVALAPVEVDEQSETATRWVATHTSGSGTVEARLWWTADPSQDRPDQFGLDPQHVETITMQEG